MIKKQIKMEQSPFHKERQEKPLGKELKARLPIQAREELETYFEKHYGDVSKGVRDVLMNFLNNLCQERQYFRNLKAIILTPKTFDPEELNEKAHVIGFIDGEFDSFNPIIFLARADYNLKLKHICGLVEFEEEYFNALGLHTLNESVLFDIDKKTQDDFESLKKRLRELYPDIDPDDAYFSMFHLNNYLDIEDKGLFHSKTSTYLHEGALVLLTDFDNQVCARLKWSHAQDVFSLDVEFHHERYYINEMSQEMVKNGYEYKYLNIGTTLSREESLKRKIRSYDSTIKHYQDLRAKAQSRLDELEENS